MMVNEILVVTTQSLDGIIIKQYLKPISAHVVAGTNFFSDFFASFSDVFGGRSQTYQRQLSSIYNEAIDLLRQSAYVNGANCILGLKVDLDEISGKGKSMFMITATGTAVIIGTEGKLPSKKAQEEKTELISADKMVELRKRKNIIDSVRNNTIQMDDATWDFITSNCVHEVAHEMIERTHAKYNNPYEIQDKLYQQLFLYLSALPGELLTDMLYNYLMSDKSKDFTHVLYRLITDLMIFSQPKLKTFLSSQDREIKRKALQVCTIEKAFYSKEDILSYQELIKTIEANFTKVGEITTQKKLLSSKEVDIWVCQCGGKNNIEYSYCPTCKKNIYGFFASEINPEKAISKMNETIDLIRANIN
jgi:uncharacterized protein YbjQ (UPF0145 family)